MGKVYTTSGMELAPPQKIWCHAENELMGCYTLYGMSYCCSKCGLNINHPSYWDNHRHFLTEDEMIEWKLTHEL